MSGSSMIEGHPPRAHIQEAPTFLEEIKAISILVLRDTQHPELRKRAEAIREKLNRMGVKDVV